MHTIDFTDACTSADSLPNIFEMQVFHDGAAILSHQSSKITTLSHINGIPVTLSSMSNICCNLLEKGLQTLSVSDNLENAEMGNTSLLSIVRLSIPDGTLGIDVQALLYSNNLSALKVMSGRGAPLFRSGDIIFQINDIPIGNLSTSETIQLFTNSCNRHILVFRNVFDDFELFNRQAWKATMKKYLSFLQKTTRIPKPLSFKEPYRSVGSVQLTSKSSSVSHLKSIRARVLIQPSCGVSTTSSF